MDIAMAKVLDLRQLKVPELKEVLTALSLVKTGRKQDLIDRIIKYCSEDESSRTARVGQIVTRVLAGSGCAGSTPAAASSSPLLQQPAPSGPPAGQAKVPFAGALLCICSGGSAPAADRSLVGCTRCGCLQHRACVQIPAYEHSAAAKHVCEVCRLRDADPAVVVVGEPHRLSLGLHHAHAAPTTNRRVQGTLRLSGEELALVAHDPAVELRMYVLELRPPGVHNRWPVGLVVSVNGVEVDARLPPASWDYAAGRYKVRPVDEVCVLGAPIRWAPANVVVASAVVQTSSVLCVQLVRRLSAEQLAGGIVRGSELNPALSLEAMRARLLGRCFPEQDDEDLVQTAVNLSLRCPLTLTRVRTPVRSLLCGHTETFDLLAHVTSQLASKCPRWSCPLCGKSARPHELQLDSFVQSILEASAKQEFTEVELQDDGSFKPPRALASETPRTKRQRQSGGGPSGSQQAAAVVDLDDGPDEPRPASAAPPKAPAPAPAPAPMPARAEPAGGSSAESGGSSGGSRAVLTQQDMARVMADACAMAAAPRDEAGQRAETAESQSAYAHIRDLFLSLEQDPHTPDARAFAHEQALALLGRRSSEPSARPPGAPSHAHTAAPPLRGAPAAKHGAQPLMAQPPPRLAHHVAPTGGVFSLGAAVDNPICLD